jgi:RNA polymerase sigma-70 factor (ECF subfamily)
MPDGVVMGGFWHQEYERMAYEVRPRLFRFALKLTRKPEDAEDLVQESLLRAFRSFSSYKPQWSFFTWVATIARNCFYDSRRKAARAGQQTSLEEIGGDGRVAPLEQRPGPEDQAMERESRFILERAVQQVPSAYRSVLKLCELENRSYLEAASELGLPVGTIRSRLFRGRQMLRRNLLENLAAP